MLSSASSGSEHLSTYFIRTFVAVDLSAGFGFPLYLASSNEGYYGHTGHSHTAGFLHLNQTIRPYPLHHVFLRTHSCSRFRLISLVCIKTTCIPGRHHWVLFMSVYEWASGLTQALGKGFTVMVSCLGTLLLQSWNAASA
jgi:hypothetical protein